MSCADDPVGRLSRFGDWSPLRQLSVSGIGDGGRPFYAGDAVDARMMLVRRAIEEIRANWHCYPNYMAGLRDLMQPLVDADGDVDLQRRAAKLFASDKKWVDLGNATETAEYSAVRLYTSARGYRQMFSAINRAFREDRMVDDAAMLRSAVFLVELLNIDLFNFWAQHSFARDYEGRIYRGMVVTSGELAAFSAAATQAVADRYVAIPLGMLSASTDRATALEFIDWQTRRASDGEPLLWEIEAVSLPAERLELYRAAFPTSVVSTICAVPIERLSDFREEDEVLLRGPFFQIVRIRRADDWVGGRRLHVVEALTLTANRDHPTTMRLVGSEATAGRELFRVVVAAERCRQCAHRARGNRASQDAAAFAALASDHERHVGELLRVIRRRRAG